MSTTTASVLVEKVCSNCGALDAHTYADSGIGAWESVNTTSSAMETPVSISGLNGWDVTLVFTNQTGTAQPIDIVIAKFNRGSGMAGYFYGRNAFKRDLQTPYSNESVSLYLNSEETYLHGTDGLNYMRSAMAHEAMHMQNFYRRGVPRVWMRPTNSRRGWRKLQP
ncbi:hypothetical protein AWV79_30215 [Cupriavidus sp. UYMMa02A]|nr:hypothetical protein AWV79_30215 [Cupriavidus sp. UYMMa02A]